MPAQGIGRKVFAALAVFCGFALVLLQVFKNSFATPLVKGEPVTVAQIGERMLRTDGGGYALPFEVVSMLLLAAMIGCIVIALREKKKGNNE
jgi:NADH-quinone oxidoreductase subunit J